MNETAAAAPLRPLTHYYAGPAERSTSRKAVRADVEVPVRMRMNNTEVSGDTVDLSEAGMRALVDGWGLAPEAGTPVAVDIELDDDLVRVHGTVVRQDQRAGRWVVSVRFEGVEEKDGDRLRKRVFQALREEAFDFILTVPNALPATPHKGMKDGLGDAAEKMLIATASYEVTESTCCCTALHRKDAS